MSTLTIGNYTLKHFDLKAKDTMDHYLKLINVDISDYTFAGNYIWLSTASGFYAIINDTFCLFILSSGELSMLLPPLGTKEKTYDAMIQCFEIMNTHNSSKHYGKIEYVHENLLEGFVDYLEEGTVIYDMLKDFVIEKKLVDYIYKVDDLIELKGDPYKSKRNEINKFKKVYENHRIEVIDIDKHKDGIMQLFNKWVKDRTTYMPKEEVEVFLDGIYFERFAIKKLLNDYTKLNVVGMVLYIDDEIKGFTVGELINETTSSIIIEKLISKYLDVHNLSLESFQNILKSFTTVSISM